jgi:endonuclease YncB( thermonuclease family)
MRGVRLSVVAIASILAMNAANAQSQASPWFPVSAGAVFETGDSWSDAGGTYRLYGVQSYLRGTSFTNGHGERRDCGEASLAMLAALIRDLKPQCYVAAGTPATRSRFVFCVATLAEGAAKGSRIDLGTALISTGFAFAALKPDGSAVHQPYLVAQRLAQQTHAGLWAFADLPDPNVIIQRALRQGQALSLDAPPPR